MESKIFDEIRKLGASWLPLLSDKLLCTYARFVCDGLSDSQERIKRLAAILNVQEVISDEENIELLELDREVESYKCVLDVVLAECVSRNLYDQLRSLGIINISLINNSNEST